MKTVSNRTKTYEIRQIHGFTLVEMIVTLLVLSVISAVSVPTVIGFIDDGRARECKANRETLREEIVAAQLANDADGVYRGSDAKAKNYNVQTHLDESDIQCPVHGKYHYDEPANKIYCVTTEVDREHGATVMKRNDDFNISFTVVERTTESGGSTDPAGPGGESGGPTNPPGPGTITDPEKEDGGSGDGTEPGGSETDPSEGSSEPTNPPGPITDPEIGGGSGGQETNPGGQETNPSEGSGGESQGGGDSSGTTGREEETNPSEGTGSGETKEPEPEVDPSEPYKGLNGDELAAGSWYEFIRDLTLWGTDYTNGRDGHQRLFYIEDENGQRTYYLFNGNGGGRAGNVSQEINENFSPEDYKKKYGDETVVQVLVSPVKYEDIEREYTKDGTVPLGTVVCSGGQYYVAATGNRSYLRDINPYNGGVTWFLLEDAYVPYTTVEVGNMTYPATDEKTLKELASTKKKWFESGNLLIKNGEIYVCKGDSFSVTGGEGISDEVLSKHFVKLDISEIKDAEDENFKLEDTPQKGSLLKYKGRYFYFLDGGGQYRRVENQRTTCLLLR